MMEHAARFTFEPAIRVLCRREPGTAARLGDGLDIVVLDETEEDGMSFLGPKHWHVFDLIVRKPATTG
jgi:hypothetical protein